MPLPLLGVSAMAVTETSPPVKVVLLPTREVTLSAELASATETPIAPPPTATPSEVAEMSGVAEADTRVPRPVEEVVIAALLPISASTVESSLAVAAAPVPATIPPATAVADADNSPASVAVTATVELLTLALSRILAATELDFAVVAIVTPTAAMPPLPPPAVAAWVEVSRALT
jgi:hypothetical protein